jgi:competence protein ComEC
MPCAALAVALMPVGLDFIPLKLMGFGIVAMLAVGHWVSALPGAVTVAAAWPIGALVLISFGGLWCAIWRQHWRWLGLLPAAAGIVLAYGLHAPDLLIARDAVTAAVRTVHGSLAFVRWPKDGYSAGEWLKRDGDGRAITQAIAAAKDGVLCDGDGCVAHVKGKVIAFPSRAEALVEDCERADILVSAVPLSIGCASPSLVLDPEEISDAGGYAIWLSPFQIESVRTVRGERPWSMAPGAADFSTDE